MLGCTHFLFFLPQIKYLIPAEIEILDGNVGTAKRLEMLISNSTKESGTVEYLVSGKKVPIMYFDHYIRYFQELQIND